MICSLKIYIYGLGHKTKKLCRNSLVCTLIPILNFPSHANELYPFALLYLCNIVLVFQHSLKNSGKTFSSLVAFQNKDQEQNGFRFFTFKPFFFSFSFWKFWSPWQHWHPSALPSWSCHKRWTICWCYHSNLPCFSLQWAAGVFRCSHDRRNYTKRPCSSSMYRLRKELSCINSPYCRCKVCF